MPSKTQLTWILPLACGLTLLQGCAHPATSPSLTLTQSDVTPAADAPVPKTIHFGDPKPTGREERDFIFRELLKPLLDFSLSQENTIAAERQRAQGLAEKIRAYNEAVKPKRKFLGVW